MADKSQGWQGQRGRHAKAGMGKNTSGKGYAGNTKPHSDAAKDSNNSNKSEGGVLDNLL